MFTFIQKARVEHVFWHAPLLFAALGVLSAVSCRSVEDLSLRLSWRIPLYEEVERTSESTYPIFCRDIAVAAKLSKAGESEFYGIDARKGRVIWKRSLPECGEGLYYNLKAYVYDRGVVIPCGNTLVNLRPETGEVQATYRQPSSAEPFLEAGVAPRTFLQAVNDWQGQVSYLYEVDAETLRPRVLYSVSWPDSAKLLLRTPVALSDSVLLFTSIAMAYGSRETVARWHFLHRQKGHILAQGTAYPSNREGYGVTKQPLLSKDKVYLVAYDQVFCLSTATAEELWRKTLPRDMLTSSPVAAADGLFCPMEDGYLYKLRLEDGELLWKTRIAPTPSRLAVVEDVLFAVGGSDGVLYAVDTRDGSLLRQLKAPNHGFVENHFFRRFIGVEDKQEVLLLFDGNSYRGYRIWE